MSDAMSPPGARESGRPTVFDPCRYGDRVEAIGASHNAAGWGIWDDQRVRMTVLIVDDHDGFRESAQALLAATGFAWFAPDYAVAGAAALAWLRAPALDLYRGPLVQLVLLYPT